MYSKQEQMVSIFNENGRAFMQSYRVVPQTKGGNMIT